MLFGVTGGIAGYKMLETARLAITAGHSVRVIQTPAAQRFVGAASFAGITGAPVLSDEFEDDPLRGAYPGEPATDRAPISHLALVENADAYLIAPASANTIAKLAGGHADNLVTTAALAAGAAGRAGVIPVLVAPAMNNRMYEHPAVQANLRLLAQRGVTVIHPGEGPLASHGEHGIGRLAEPTELLAAMEARLAASDGPLGGRAPWRGVRVLVTAGGTREPIDSVRYVGNRSSGRMGYALAQRAARRGATVTVVSANVALTPPPGMEVVAVETAAQLAAATAERFDDTDVVLMAAAVADFRPRDPASHKLKKDEGPPRVELEPTEDVLSGLASRRRPGQVLVGFAAEHGEGAVDYARGKLERKRLDAIVVNDVSQPGIGFDSTENEVTILLAAGGERRLTRSSKESIADGVLDEVEKVSARFKESDDRAIRTDPARPTRV